MTEGGGEGGVLGWPWPMFTRYKCEIQIIIECKAARVIGLLDPALTLLLSHDTPLVPCPPPIQHPITHPPFLPLRARDPLPPPPPHLLLSLLFSRDQDAV